MTQIVVLGSINVDLVLNVPTLPAPGQTVLGGRLCTSGGGKGANQAIAAARLSSPPGPVLPVRMVGRVGADAHGESQRAELAAAGVDVSAVIADPDHATGVALILVNRDGENVIAVAPGANAAVGADDAARAAGPLQADDVLVCQLEVPQSAVLQAATVARDRGARVLVNVAPAVSVDPALLDLVDVVVANETEAVTVLGRPVATAGQARAVAESAGYTLVVTLGAAGAVFASPGGPAGHYPAIAVAAVDTVGAGDAFVGALVVRLAAGASLDEAVAAGVAAGGLAVTKPGAREALPDAAALARLLGPGGWRGVTGR